MLSMCSTAFRTSDSLVDRFNDGKFFRVTCPFLFSFVSFSRMPRRSNQWCGSVMSANGAADYIMICGRRSFIYSWGGKKKHEF